MVKEVDAVVEEEWELVGLIVGLWVGPTKPCSGPCLRPGCACAAAMSCPFPICGTSTVDTQLQLPAILPQH